MNILRALLSFFRNIFQPKASAGGKIRRRKRANRVGFKELLELLDNVWVDIEKRFSYKSHMTRKMMRTIRNIGPIIPHHGLSQVSLYSATKVEMDGKLPSIIYIAFGPKEDNPGEDIMHLRFFCAMKVSHLPANIIANKGSNYANYETVLAYQPDDKILWLSLFIQVDQGTGICSIPEQISSKQVIIRGNGHRPNAFYQRARAKQILVEIWDRRAKESGQLIDATKAIHFAFNVQMRCQHAWKIGLEKNGRHANFAIDDNTAKEYFKDRPVTIRTKNGQRKRIIHEVRKHTRIVNGRKVTVKKHTRGIREFPWKDYNVTITAPKWHKFLVDDIDAAGIDEYEVETAGNVYDVLDIANIMAENERIQPNVSRMPTPIKIRHKEQS